MITACPSCQPLADRMAALEEVCQELAEILGAKMKRAGIPVTPELVRANVPAEPAAPLPRLPHTPARERGGLYVVPDERSAS